MSDQLGAPARRGAQYWVGWALSGLVIAFMVMDFSMKLMALPVVLQASGLLGFSGAGMARELGVILLVCTALYAAPPTAVLGAVQTRRITPSSRAMPAPEKPSSPLA